MSVFGRGHFLGKRTHHWVWGLLRGFFLPIVCFILIECNTFYNFPFLLLNVPFSALIQLQQNPLSRFATFTYDNKYGILATMICYRDLMTLSSWRVCDCRGVVVSLFLLLLILKPFSPFFIPSILILLVSERKWFDEIFTILFLIFTVTFPALDRR